MADWKGYANYDHYWWVNHPGDLGKWFNEAVEAGIEVIGTKVKYYNIPNMFDIETSSFYKMGDKYATMYLWSFCFNGSTILGRTWKEWVQVVNYLEYHLNTKKINLIIYVQNLGYEFQFMRGWFNWKDVFAIKERRPIHATLHDGIEFKCSYILSNYALAYIGEKLIRKYKVQKDVGALDYSKIRHSKTPLEDKEIWYSVHDVQVGTSYIQEKIENEGGIDKIPLTNTGYVRQYCREYCFTQFVQDKKLQRKLSARYHERMRCMQITSECEYNQLHQAFAGGFTHAAPSHSGDTLHDLGSADLASSYPAVMCLKKFPMGKSTYVGNCTEKDIDFLIKKGYCVLFTVRLSGLTPRFIYENYVSISRCSEVSKDAVVNNGRVAAASCIQLTVTEQDWDIIKKCYEWDKAEFFSARYYIADYLPRPFIMSILNLFSKKTSLKDVEGKETEYMVSKNMINSAYGMSVTNIIRDLYEYSNTDGWVSEDADVTSQLLSYNNNHNRFLFYAWGVWVTAHARHNLWDAIFEFAEDYVYVDTDSIKGLNFDKHKAFFTLYNLKIEKMINDVCKYWQIPKSLFHPQTVKGKTKTLGIWEIEESYRTFKTIGAKRYIYEYESGELLFTISGVNKYCGVPYLLSEYTKWKGDDEKLELFKLAYSNNPSTRAESKEAMKKVIEMHESGELDYDEIFEQFSEGLYFPAEFTGKQTLTYIDKPTIVECIDYMGQPLRVFELSYIHMEPQAYYMSQTAEYLRYLEGYKDASI